MISGFALLRCVLFQRNIHIAADFLQIRYGFPMRFQLGVLRFVLDGQLRKLGLPRFRGQLHIRQVSPQITVSSFPYREVGSVRFRKLFLFAFPTDLLVFIVDGLRLLEVLRLLNQLLELLNSRFPRLHSTTDFACLIADRGQGSVQFLQSEDTLFRKEIDCVGNGFEFVCGVLLLPTLRILPALCFLNIQIAEQQR